MRTWFHHFKDPSNPSCRFWRQLAFWDNHVDSGKEKRLNLPTCRTNVGKRRKANKTKAFDSAEISLRSCTLICLGSSGSATKAAEAIGNGKRLLVVRLNCLSRKESRHSNQLLFFSPLASCIMFSQGVPMPVQNGGQQSFAQLVRFKGRHISLCK